MELMENILGLAFQVKEATESAAANKEQCREIGSRTARIAEKLQQVPTAAMERIAASPMLGELASTLESAVGLCGEYSKKGYLGRIWGSHSDAEKFTGIINRLNRAAQDMQVWACLQAN